MIGPVKSLLIRHRTRLYLYLSKFLSQKQYWNLVGRLSPLDAILDGYFDQKAFFQTGKETVDFLAKQKLIDKNSLTLHIGCGLGRIEKHLSPKVKSCYGVDISEAMIAQANLYNQAKNAFFITTDGQNLPFASHYFDLIYSVLVFQHLPRSMFKQNLKEAKRVLKRKGKLFFQIPLDEKGIKENPSETNPWLLRYYQRAEIRRLLNRLGFRVDQTFNGFGPDQKLDLEPNFAILATKV